MQTLDLFYYTKPKLTTITPDIALKMIEYSNECAKNGGFKNRKLSIKHIEELAKKMSDGKWIHNNGDTIRLTEDGAVCDGNHRLHAVIKSGVTIQALVIKVPNESIDTIDKGRKRSDADNAYIKRMLVKNTQPVTFAIKMLYLFDQGLDLFKEIIPRREKARISMYEWEQFIPKYSYLQDIRFHDIRDFMTRIHVLFLYAIAKDMGKEEKFKNFLGDIISGENLKKGNPALAFRNCVNKVREYKDSTIFRSKRLYAFIKAWQAYESDHELRSIVIPNDNLSVHIDGWHIKM